MERLLIVLGMMYIFLTDGVYSVYDPPATIPPPEEFARILSQESVPREDTVVQLEKTLEARLGLPRGRQIPPFSKFKADEVITVHVGENN